MIKYYCDFGPDGATIHTGSHTKTVGQYVVFNRLVLFNAAMYYARSIVQCDLGEKPRWIKGGPLEMTGGEGCIVELSADEEKQLLLQAVRSQAWETI